MTQPSYAELVAVLQGWANQMAARFGHPVWLVGSALEQGADARDVDVRIVLPDDEYEARYGGPWQNPWQPWDEQQRRWGVDMAKMNRQACQVARLNVDFQVQADIEAIAFRDKPRVRLDNLELDS